MSTRRPVNRSTCQPFNTSTCRTVYLSTCQSICLSIPQPVDLSTRLSIDLSTRRIVNPSICRPVELSTCHPIDLSTGGPVIPLNFISNLIVLSFSIVLIYNTFFWSFGNLNIITIIDLFNYSTDQTQPITRVNPGFTLVLLM